MVQQEVMQSVAISKHAKHLYTQY